ncbi:unconventional myosin-IXAb-like isoform X4 [Mercenaria mercenaria]|uniref:unconventional myosin-IXAb-like isoform X4 n=1 Tax=Mercenaria mercenaria TaxID=6596 RepID=UPI00234E6BA5|nr:unconventional myosin-IXAb-like isoform X4 [Mercenaria mercenaria]
MMALSPLTANPGRGSVAIIRRMSMETFMVRIYTGPLSQEHEFVSVEAEKITTADDVVKVAAKKLSLRDPDNYELAEVLSTAGQLCKERRLEDGENPVRIQLLWPTKIVNADVDRGHGLHTGYRFYIRKKNRENSNRTSLWIEYTDPNPVDNFLTAFLKQPTSNKEYSDLCNLPDLNERTLLENIKSRFHNANIYTYVGSILIAVNPFKFFPIYNPKFVKEYQCKRLGERPPHIFAIADAAFHTMLRTKKNQCIVISGESGSGKTESTNLLLHHLTALSHKGLHGSGVEQTILGAGPVLEAFGNAKTVHNNNSSRFGKFIQVNYKENGMVHGAIVEKYLLEKSRIVSQASNERNYHVFYYLLEGADNLEREKLRLGKPEDYFYLRQSDCYNVEDLDEANEFSRLKQSMEMVAFSQVTQKRIFGVLSAVLHLGNVTFKKKGDQHHDESVTIVNPETITIISKLLMVKERTLVEALTQKKTVAGDETVVMTHRMEHAVATRDAMAKCLYGALFDWIVLKVNQALLAKRHNSEHQAADSTDKTNYVRHTGNSIGVLDIFGFEDFRWNSFEQFCINYANEHLQYYFNQHIFKFEQEEYKKEGIQWKNIEFIDNTGCLELFSRKGNGLFSLLDEECNFPGASNETLLSKFHHHHSRGNVYYEAPQKKEMAFAVLHYAGKVKYQTKDFREKNSDQIRMDIVANMKSSSLSFVRELMGVDPVAVLRWTILKTLIKSVFAFIRAGKTYRHRGGPDISVIQRRKTSTDHLTIPDLGSSHFLSFYTCAQTIKLIKKIHPRRISPTDPPKHRSPRSSVHDKRHSHRDNNYGTDDEDDDVFMSGQRHSSSLRSPVDAYLSEDDARVMRRATKVLMKNKSFKPKSRPQTMFSDIKTLKAIANRTIYIGGKVNTKQKPPSVGAQFQWSLSRLMATLNQANPFFIRCIKSNAEKLPCKLDDVLVLRQLRYTGMLATVRIRQSGYNYRLLFEEFVQLYKILLPKGLSSGKEDVSQFLESMNMNQDNYQIGKTKVFLRETEKLLIDECLHHAIMKRVITIQRWVKTKVERRNYIQLRESTVILQKYIRRFIAQRRVEMFREAVLLIQRCYRGSRERKNYHLVRRSAIRIQAHVKGHLCRKRYREMEAELRRQRAEREAVKQAEDMHSSTSDEGVLLKDNSADELELQGAQYQRRDSEESSGILDDSESDTLSEAKSRGDSVSSPPATPTSQGPEIYIESLPGSKDKFLTETGRSSRVQDLAKKFQSPGSQTSDDVDGRPTPDIIYVPRGSSARKRPPKMSPAPLAKQESFSDLVDLVDGKLVQDSPTASDVRVSPLSPEKMQLVEDALKKPRSHTGESLHASAEDVSISPFKRVMKGAKHFVVSQENLRETKSYPCAPESATLKRKMSLSSTLLRRTKSSIKMLRDMKSGGQRKKKDSQAEESDEDVEHSPVAKHMLHTGGVPVLPHHPSMPLSPKSPVKDENIFSEDEQEKKAIQKKRRTRKGEKDKENRPMEVQKGWNLAKTSQWQYPEEFVITETYELQLLDEFISRKIIVLVKDTGKKESQFDIVFKKCLKSFHSELKSMLSLSMQKEGSKEDGCNIKYRVLFAMFESTMRGTCEEQKVDAEFPVTLCINAFRSYLDEFRNSVNSKKKDSKFKKKKERQNRRDNKKKDIIEYQGHKFSQVQFGIPTFCELCSNIIWIMEKGHVCQICKYACHRKCVYKSTSTCKGAQDLNNQLFSQPPKPYSVIVGPSVNCVFRQFNAITQRIVGTKVFGVSLQSLVGPEDTIPVFMDNLIMLIETHGLFTEGIYRKSGAAPKINQLKTVLDNGVTEISIEDNPVHVLTSTLKTFFRELPEPLLTFEFYDEFIQASEIHDEKEAIQVLFSLIERLPKVNHDVLERLIFHLARVAQHEKNNKMSVNSLAIIFAPCLLRTNRIVQAQDMIMQVSRQQLCIEKILQEQLYKLKATLQDINTLESAEATANERLSVVRASMRNSTNVGKKQVQVQPSLSEDTETLEEQERVINSHIQSLRIEKESLTNTLPVFEYRHSSDDEMLSADDIESTDDSEYQAEDPNFETPAKAPTQLKHLTKHRVEVPGKRRPPTQLFKQRSMDDMDTLEKETSEQFLNGKHSCSTEDNTYMFKYSSSNKSTVNQGERRQLLDSLDLHSPDSRSIDQTRKKVGEHFKKVKGKQTSALSKQLRESDQIVVSSETLSTAIAKDSLYLLKPKLYQDALSPKLKTKSPKSHLYSQVPSKTDLSRSKPVQEKKRKSPGKDYDVLVGTSPQHQMQLSSRPLRLTSGHANPERMSSYDNTNLSVMENSDPEDEIMV